MCCDAMQGAGDIKMTKLQLYLKELTVCWEDKLPNG